MTSNLIEDAFYVRYSMFGGDPLSSQLTQFALNVYDNIKYERDPENLDFLFFKISNYCNSDCEYCAHAVSRCKDEFKSDVPLEIVKRVLSEAAQLKTKFVTLSGGEPLLRADFPEMVSTCRQYGMLPIMLTNGTLLPKTWHSIGEAGIRYIIISFDSMDKAIYEKHRGISYELALKGIEAASVMKKYYENTEVHVSVVLSADNIDTFMDLLKYMNSFGIKVQITPLHDYYHKEKPFTDAQNEAVRKLTQHLLDYKRKGGLISNHELFLQHLPEFFSTGNRVPEWYSCKVGYSSVFIDALMNVRCCWDTSFEPVGNLRDQSLVDMWHSKRMSGYRKRMLKCACDNCWYMCTADGTLLIDEMYARINENGTKKG